jgi:hypothetical protein
MARGLRRCLLTSSPASAGHVNELRRLRPFRGASPDVRRLTWPTRETAIEFIDLVKVYGGDTRAVDQVSFDADRGELFGCLGPNGAGKSTNIRIPGRLPRPTSGAVVARYDAFSTGRETARADGPAAPHAQTGHPHAHRRCIYSGGMKRRLDLGTATGAGRGLQSVKSPRASCSPVPQSRQRRLGAGGRRRAHWRSGIQLRRRDRR